MNIGRMHSNKIDITKCITLEYIFPKFAFGIIYVENFIKN